MPLVCFATRLFISECLIDQDGWSRWIIKILFFKVGRQPHSSAALEWWPSTSKSPSSICSSSLDVSVRLTHSRVAGTVGGFCFFLLWLFTGLLVYVGFFWHICRFGIGPDGWLVLLVGAIFISIYFCRFWTSTASPVRMPILTACGSIWALCCFMYCTFASVAIKDF